VRRIMCYMVNIVEGNTQTKPKRVCACGICGDEIITRINRNTRQPVRYKRGHHVYGQKGELNNNWKGGRKFDKNGYILIYCPTHPFNVGGYIFEHRLVIEQHVDRYLKSYELVHHHNEVKTDNRIENLQLLTPSQHLILHQKLRREKKIITAAGQLW